MDLMKTTPTPTQPEQPVPATTADLLNQEIWQILQENGYLDYLPQPSLSE